jgi:hypothetical protein
LRWQTLVIPKQFNASGTNRVIEKSRFPVCHAGYLPFCADLVGSSWLIRQYERELSGYLKQRAFGKGPWFFVISPGRPK